MRINGRGRVVDDGNLLAELKEGDKLPKTATVVLVDAVLLHCGKAIDRAGLWTPAAQLDKDALPAFPRMADAQARFSTEQVNAMNDHYAQAVRNELY